MPHGNHFQANYESGGSQRLNVLSPHQKQIEGELPGGIAHLILAEDSLFDGQMDPPATTCQAVLSTLIEPHELLEDVWNSE